tara:strand:+ start:33 stop:515 length:483 start_codon:yes stop_codon:yes gene_type:complete
MAIIKPTLNLTANANTASTEAGPMSMSLALSIADSLSVDLVDQQLIETSDTVTQLLDGSDVGGGTETPATIGCYIFLRNNSSTTNENIYVGIVAGGGSDTPSAPAASGTTALDEATNATLRTMTLLPGEFAWFPYDYTGDIYYESATGTPALEYWRFDKA